jgi:hypothetical protein
MKLWKKMMISMLAFTLVAGGASSAFADNSNSHKFGWDRDDDRKKDHDDDDDDDDDKVRGIHIEVDGKKIELKFDDVRGEAAWALQYIAELVKRGVFTGYEDGTFRPNQKVTRIEAITAAVRQMGLRTQAESAAEMSTELNFKDAEKIEGKYPWAVGYVAVALENDLFMESDNEVKPDKPADRQWATVLLVKALGLEDEAKAKMNTELTFKDKKDIDAGAVGYIAVAIEKGLITGYDNNTFEPKKTITRAEMAALLDRTGDQIPDSETGFGQVDGTFTSLANGKLNLTVNGTAKAYSVSQSVTVLRNNTFVDMDDLQAGDAITTVISNGLVIYVRMTGTAADTSVQVAGTITAVTSNSVSIAKNGTTTAYSLRADATFYRNNASIPLSSLLVGDQVSGVLVNGAIQHLAVTAAVPVNGQVDGTVTTVGSNTVTLLKNGVSTQYSVGSTASIIRNHALVSITAVVPGDKVEATLSNGSLLLITVTEPVSSTNDMVYTVTGTYQGRNVVNGKVTQISVTKTVNNSPVTQIYNVSPTLVFNGDALLLVEGQTQLELIVVNQIVTIATIK